MSIQLKTSPGAAHDVFATFASEAQRLQDLVARVGERSVAYVELGAQVAALHRSGCELLDSQLARGSHATALRQALSGPGIEQQLRRFDEAIREAYNSEARGSLDKPGLHRLIQHRRDQVLATLEELIRITLEILAAIEVLPGFSTQGTTPEAQHRLPRLDVVFGDKLGEGAFGSVWQARDQLLERHIAVKFLTSTDQAMDENALLREAQNLARVSHPNLVHVYGAAYLRHPLTGLVAPALTMELLVGEVLIKWWDRQHERSAIFTAIRGLVAGLQAMHAAGLHHGDLHARNVMVLADGTVKLIDWRYQDSFLAQPTCDRQDLIEVEERLGIEFVARILEKQGLRADAASIRRQDNLAAVTSALAAMMLPPAIEAPPGFDAEPMMMEVPSVVAGFEPGPHADCARELISRLAANGGHRELDLATFVRESTRDAQVVRDVAEVMEQEGLVLRERMNKVLRLTRDGREEAHRLGEDIPSPAADAQALLVYLMSRKDRAATADDTELTASLGFNLRRLIEAGELLEESGEATTTNSIGRMRITLSARNRIR